MYTCLIQQEYKMKKYLYVFCKKFTNYSLECSTLDEALDLAFKDVNPIFILKDNRVLLNQMDIAKLHKERK